MFNRLIDTILRSYYVMLFNRFFTLNIWFRYLLLLLFFGSFIINSFGQCMVDTLLGGAINIASIDTVNLRILVENAELDRLENDDQGLCEVRLEFIHQDITDLNISLYSPDVDNSILVGPAEPTGSGLQIFGIPHDIGFIPSYTAPSPDPGLSDRWDNRDPNWGDNGAYSGNYWPFGGDLDINFATGNVNGVWELVISDQFLGSLDPSVFESFEIKFCNQEISCMVCEATSGDFLVDSISVCEGQTLDINTVYQPIADPQNLYSEIPISFSGNAIFTVDDIPAFEGSFEFYIITILSKQKDAFISELSGLNKISLLDLIASYGGAYCVDISEPIQINIKKSSGVISSVIDTSIIGCNSATTLLDGSLSSTNDSTVITWTDDNGVFLSDQLIVNVSETGSYLLRLDDGICSDSSRVLVVQESSLVNTQILSTVDTINCVDSTATLSFATDMAVLDVHWEYFGQTSDIDSIRINQEGDYILFLNGPGSCQSLDTISIYKNIEVSDLLIDFDTITCENRTTEVSVTNSNSFIDFEWYNAQDSLLSTHRSLNISDADDFRIVGINPNGCLSELDFTTYMDTITPPLQGVLRDTLLDCLNDTLLLNVESSKTFILTRSFNGGAFEFSEASEKIFTGGSFSYLANYDNGCSERFGFTVTDLRSDSTLDDQEVLLTCEVDSLVLDSGLDTSRYSMNWEGRNLSVFVGSNPVVRDSGLYRFTGTNNLTFCEVRGNIFVDSNRDDPLEVISGDTSINCIDSIAIFEILSDPDALTSWNLPSGETILSPTIETSNAGQYEYRIEGSNGCVINGFWNVSSDKNLSEIPIDDSLELTCILDTLQLTLSEEDYQNVEWQFLELSSQEFDISIAEEMKLDVTVEGYNGCKASKSIEILSNTDTPKVLISNNDTVLCAPQSMLLSPDNIDLAIHDYLWTVNGAETSNNPELLTNDTGLFILQSSFISNGCISFDTVEISLSNSPLLGMDITVISESCLGENDGSIIFSNINGGVLPINISVDSTDILDMTLNDLTPASYNILVNDAVNCSIDTTVNILSGDDLVIELGEDIVVPVNTAFNITPFIDGDYFDLDWFINGQSIDIPLEEIIERIANEDEEIILQALTENGCVFRDTLLVNAVFTLDQVGLYVPNAFIPESDNVNGSLWVSLPSQIESILRFSIYDRNGAKIHEVLNPNGRFRVELWDGKMNNNWVNPGVYVYTCETLTTIDGQSKLFSGTITVIR